ncbi:MAG: nitrous oxide reductase family maturation protein NosD [Bacteroidia bacterium]|nr:nitrous oxide reductase family maturation protein NosD [Bacteroidia bacterium]
MNCKRNIFFLSLILFVLCSTEAKADHIIVCPSCEVKTIEDAIDLADPCDTIFIKPGTYKTANVIVEKSLNIIGIDYPIWVSRDGEEILTINARDVLVKGINFKHVKTSYLKENSAIRVADKRHFIIEDNIIDSCFFGIYLQHAKNGVIINNRFNGNATTEAESGNGIHAWYCDGIQIEKNIVKGHRDGIYFEFVNNSSVINNYSEKNKRYGLHFMFSNDDTYDSNVFKDNGVGVAVMFSRRIKMRDNIFSYNWGGSSYGLLLKEIFDAEIENNVFKQNTMGIFVEGSNRVNYFRNDFIRNGWAIKFSGGCEDNELHRNNFINNSLDLVINSQLNTNSIHHNYWSNYSGYDLDKDKIGDVPHYPVKLFYYVIDRTPEAIILMRSLFVDIINFAEKVSPIFTPKDVFDPHPLMNKAS